MNLHFLKMLAITTTGCIEGITAIPIQVEVRLQDNGFPGFKIVGLAEGAVKESKVRVLAALARCGYYFSESNVTVNLIPANIRKSGSSYDLAIAIALIAARGVISSENLNDYIFLGELTLHSNIRAVSGALPVALCALKEGKKGIVVPAGNIQEVSIVKGIRIIGAESLADVIDIFNNYLARSGESDKTPDEILHNDIQAKLPAGIYITGEKGNDNEINDQLTANESDENAISIADVKGQYAAKRALSIAAAGGHNVLMIGPPGSGKTMLAKAFSSILPPLSFHESLETTAIYSVAGLLKNKGSLIKRRPFRAPHHTISYGGLVGGGNPPKPGEISLAHNGVLFLDEFPEFSRWILDTLRQPIEEGFITISRSWGTVTYPASFSLIAAMNPCPCGNLGSQKECRCTQEMIKRYHSKISGPILDRIDIKVSVPFQNSKILSSPKNECENIKIKDEIIKARKIQEDRYKAEGCKNRTNAGMSEKNIEKFCPCVVKAKLLLEKAIDKFGLSARAYSRILKVSRTIADMEGVELIEERHVQEALHFRMESEPVQEGIIQSVMEQNLL